MVLMGENNIAKLGKNGVESRDSKGALPEVREFLGVAQDSTFFV